MPHKSDGEKRRDELFWGRVLKKAENNQYNIVGGQRRKPKMEMALMVVEKALLVVGVGYALLFFCWLVYWAVLRNNI